MRGNPRSHSPFPQIASTMLRVQMVRKEHFVNLGSVPMAVIISASRRRGRVLGSWPSGCGGDTATTPTRRAVPADIVRD